MQNSQHIYNQSGGEGVVKIFSLLFISFFICSSFSPLFANNKRDSEITVEESIKEILDSVNEIIKSGIQAGEKELREIQKALKGNEDSIHKTAEKYILEKLQEILVELRKLEKALKEDLAEGKEFSKEKREQYRKNRENLEKKIDQFKKRMKKFAEDIEKEYRLLKEPISKRAQELLKEMERVINRIQERLKRESNTDKTISI